MPKSPSVVELLNEFDRLQVKPGLHIDQFIAHEMGQVPDSFFRLKKKVADQRQHQLAQVNAEQVKTSPSAKS